MLHRRFSVETIAKSVLEPLEKPAKVTSTSDRDDSRSPHDSLKNPRSAEVRLFARNILIGAAAASFAVALRYSAGLPDGVLTFFTVIIAVCLVTVKTGLAGGITTAVLGGVLNWYLVLTPRHSWKLDSASLWVLLGFFSTAIVILATSQMYRLSERKQQAAALSRAVQDAEQQRLFAREMAHRLKTRSRSFRQWRRRLSPGTTRSFRSSTVACARSPTLMHCSTNMSGSQAPALMSLW